MGDDANTYIADHEAASHSLAAMAARAEMLGEKVGQITARISGLEAGKPWGTAEEYGGQFEKAYHAGGDGAQFVRENAQSVTVTTVDGATTAHTALRGSVEVDAEGAALFRTQASDAAGVRMTQIGNAYQQAATPAE